LTRNWPKANLPSRHGSASGKKESARGSYAALSSLSRSGIGGQDSIDYSLRLNKDLGINRSRKFIGATYAQSLPDKTERPLAILAYRSSFANEPVVVELVSLILEKNGTWTVTNYVLP
jgi:hypothetical protein